jgi:hypothetical protein
MEAFSNKFGTDFRDDLLKQLKRDTVGPVSIDMVDQKCLKTIGIKVAALIFMMNALVKEIDPTNFTLQG